VISGDASHTYEENGEDALGEYTVVAGGGATVGAWSLEGTDASSFMVDGTGDSTMLKFRSAPDYDNPMGGANDDSNTYDVTLKVTDSSESDVYGTFAVSVTVTNVSELGTLAGSRGFPHAEGEDAQVPPRIPGKPTRSRAAMAPPRSAGRWTELTPAYSGSTVRA
jgi:hypothetical protein